MTTKPPPGVSRTTLLVCAALILALMASDGQTGTGSPEPTRAAAAEASSTESAQGPPRDPKDEADAPDRDDPPADRAQGDATEDPEPPPVAEEVELHEPDLMVRSEDSLSAGDADLHGVTHRAAVVELTATAADRDGEQRELDLLGVEGETFRPLTPEVTAQSPAVWQRLAAGEILVRHDVAHHMGLELGHRIELHGEAGSVEVRIGALAANGAPPFAEVVVPRAVADGLDAPQSTALVVAVDDDHADDTVATSLEELGEVELRRPPEPEQASSQPTSGPVEIEPFTYTSRGDGTIAIHGDWVARNIVSADIPGMGTARCHRAMVPQLYAALQQIIDEGLYDHLQPEQYGGCFSPRHIMFNPRRSLSMHAWGLAIDFNVQDNWYGDEPQMDPRIVEIFERWGFAWGGHWSTPDGMHFEVERFVRVE